MTDPLGESFTRQLYELQKLLNSGWAWPSPEAGFALYVFQAAGEQVSLPPVNTIQWPPQASLRHAHSLAAAGFLMASGRDPTSAESVEWTKECEHVAATDAFPLDRQSFAYRPLELLGIALGATKRPAITKLSLDSLRTTIGRVQQDGNRDLWSRLLYRLAAHVAGRSVAELAMQIESNETASSLGLLKWISELWPSLSVLGATQQVDMLDSALLNACLGTVDATDIGRAAIIAFGLKRTVSQRIRSRLRESWPIGLETKDAILIVEQLCRRFHLFAKQMRVRRKDLVVAGQADKRPRPTVEMKDEYDVQDSLHAILRLHFDDVRDEEWAPSYAGSQTRMDFVLKRERIVVETKFMGARMTQAEVAKQLAIDEKYYRQHPDCGTLVCFVYDPDGKCDNPVALERDASANDGQFRIIVVVCPKGT